MKNKIILSILGLILTISTANASDKVHVSAVSEFNTANPSQEIDVRVIENGVLGSHELKEGDIIHCKVVKVTDPKRGKRAATFAVSPTSLTSDDKTTAIEENYYGKYSEKIISKDELKNIDAKKVGKKAAVSVGNYFVKGVAPVVSMAEGMVKNEDGNRIESGVKQVYKDSPLSYVEKGQELSIEPGEQFYLIFSPSKNKKTSDIQENTIE